MTTAQCLRVLDKINRAGFPCLELWGGAVLDACIRFTGEDPWERLEKFRDVLGGGQKIRALLRGQNLFGYQPMADDLVIAFIKQAVESGVGVMRIFDALNDFRNLQVPLRPPRLWTKPWLLSYTVSPVHRWSILSNCKKLKMKAPTSLPSRIWPAAEPKEPCSSSGPCGARPADDHFALHTTAVGLLNGAGDA